MSRELQVGDYIVEDFKGLAGHIIRATQLKEKSVVPEDAGWDEGDRGSFEEVFGGKKLHHYRERHPARVWFHGGISSSVLKMNDMRVPDAEGQAQLAAFDRKVAELRTQIAEVDREKQAYVVEHRLEWDIPELSDFDTFRGPKE